MGIRVLIVDDAAIVRRLLKEAIAADPELEVAGAARTGAHALAMLAEAKPDVVVLDLEMPEMDGLEALAILRGEHPRLPVIMFSSLTQRGAAATIDALAQGASDYVTKPTGMADVASALAHVREQLLPKIKHLGRRSSGLSFAGVARPRQPQPAGRTAPIEIVVMGVSTGGPNALATLLPTLPADFAVPVLIIQHMPPVFTRALAERLAARSALRVQEGRSGELLRPGDVWIAPGDFHMVLGREGAPRCLRLHQGPPENSCRPAVDVLFRSAAETYGAGVLAVVLTGMGHDGASGARAIRAAGGQVLAQDKGTSVIWGMPGKIVQEGLADGVFPLDAIGREVLRRVGERKPGTRRLPAPSAPGEMR